MASLLTAGLTLLFRGDFYPQKLKSKNDEVVSTFFEQIRERLIRLSALVGDSTDSGDTKKKRELEKALRNLAEQVRLYSNLTGLEKERQDAGDTVSLSLPLLGAGGGVILVAFGVSGDSGIAAVFIGYFGFLITVLGLVYFAGALSTLFQSQKLIWKKYMLVQNGSEIMEPADMTLFKEGKSGYRT